MKILFFFCFAFFCCAGIVRTCAAAAPAGLQGLMLPAACAPGQDCWIVNYVDMNPAAGAAQDYTCGAATSDGHEGSDFALRDRARMEAGVSVLAAAPGKVLRVRDGIPDRQATAADIARLLAAAKGCGNGVLLDHGNGWQSIYCQLKEGSIAVKPGDTVTAGEKIAEIGESGAAEFPHLHFGLFLNGRTIDPFSSTPAAGGCGKSKGGLWLPGLTVDYEPFSIFADGFTAAIPDFDRIRDNAKTLATTSPAIDVLAYWAGLYGLHRGDKIILTITAPDGSLFATQTIVQKQDRPRQYYYLGRRIGDPLLPGQYTGRVTIERPLIQTDMAQTGIAQTETVTAETAGPKTGHLTRSSEKIITVLNPVAQQ